MTSFYYWYNMLTKTFWLLYAVDIAYYTLIWVTRLTIGIKSQLLIYSPFINRMLEVISLYHDTYLCLFNLQYSCRDEIWVCRLICSAIPVKPCARSDYDLYKVGSLHSSTLEQFLFTFSLPLSFSSISKHVYTPLCFNLMHWVFLDSRQQITDG